MAAWRDGVAREIPTDLPGELLDSVEDAWMALSERVAREQLGEAELDALEEQLRRFESCTDRARLRLLDAWRLAGSSPFTLCLLVGAYEATSTGSTGVPQRWRSFECRMGGLFELQRSAGRALFRPESWTDKISELFKRCEVDFEDCPEFSRRYYAPATNEKQLRRAVSKPLLDHIATRADLLIELLERDMLVAWPQVIGKEAALEASNFMVDLAALAGTSAGGPYRR